MTKIDTPIAELPLLYAAWLDEWLDGSIPAETEATCATCAMLPPANGSSLELDVYFNPKTKCCTYVPVLPNFLVGRILADETPEMGRGRASMLARLQNSALVNPLWLEKGSGYDHNYTTRRDFFGRLDEMVCPHYLDEQGGLCGIWRHRNAICTTWFCKHARGDVGHQFWLTLRDLLREVENDLTQWCALELGIAPAVIRELDQLETRGETIRLLEVEQAQPELSTATLKKIWGTWYGRENAYYLECARQVAALSWSEVLAICGPTVQTLARLTHQAHAQLLSDSVPERLRPGKFKLVSMQADHSIVESYLPTDPLRIPRPVMELLPRFDGRPTSAVITETALTTGRKINPSLIRKLVDFKILVPVGERSPRAEAQGYNR